MTFDLDPELRRQLGYQLIDRINDYFSSLPDRAVQLPAEQRSFSPLEDAMPEGGADPAETLAHLCSQLIDRGFHVPSANYFGLMNPTPAYVAVLAEALVAALNPQLATLARSQLASKIENQCVRWLGDRVGWTSEFGGTFTSGGNEANFTALALALAAAFPEYVEDGVLAIGAQPVFYCSSEAHHSLDKSAGLLGIGRRAVRRVRVNHRIQLSPEALDDAIQEDLEAGARPFCIVATAGTTNSGAIDPLPEIADIARKHNLWFHVDGAYGAAAILSDRHRELVRGIELADSITVDPHKWLAMPFAAGVILTSHPEMLPQAFAVNTPLHAAPAQCRRDRQFQAEHPVVAPHEFPQALSRPAHPRTPGLRATHRSADAARASLRRTRSPRRRTSILPSSRSSPSSIFASKPATASAKKSSSACTPRSSKRSRATARRWISTTRVEGRSVIRVMIISYLTEEAPSRRAARVARNRRRPLLPPERAPRAAEPRALLRAHINR